MKKEIENKPVFKVPVPIGFIMMRIIIVLFLFALLVFKIPYELILIYALCVLFLLFQNSSSAVIEIYPEYFKLTRLDISFKQFITTEEFYYKNITEFEFKQRDTLRFLSKILSAVFFSGSQVANGDNGSSMVFSYEEAGTTYQVTRKFSYSNNQLGKAFEMISKRLKGR